MNEMLKHIENGEKILLYPFRKRLLCFVAQSMQEMALK